MNGVKRECRVSHIYNNWRNILNKVPCSLPTSVEVLAMLAAFAGLAVFAIPMAAGVDQEFPSVIQAAPHGLGIAAEGLGCAGVPGLAEVDPLFLRRGGTHFSPVPLASVPLVLGLGPCTGGFVVVADAPVVHDGLDCCSAHGAG